MNHQYAIQIVWSHEDEAYLAFTAELPGCISHGATPAEAVANIEVVIQEWLEVAKEDNMPVPPPLSLQEMQRIGEAQLKQQLQGAVENAVRILMENLQKQSAAQKSVMYMRMVEPEFAGFNRS